MTILISDIPAAAEVCLISFSEIGFDLQWGRSPTCPDVRKIDET
jgi:hypothetical protein